MYHRLRCTTLCVYFSLHVVLIHEAIAAEQLQDYMVEAITPNALQQALSQLSPDEQARFARGRSLFNQLWVAAPSLDSTVDGLGPTYNQSACAACHLRNGRGQPPSGPEQRMRGMLVRLSVPGINAGTGGPLPHLAYGDQLQEAAITAVPAEGRAVVLWKEEALNLPDGDVVMLRKPELTLTALNFDAPGPELLLSARIAPQLIGAGLIDAVPDSTLEILAARTLPDGITGRVNQVYDASLGRTVAGRFGWKANTASLLQQTAAAFSGDLGITSGMFPQENCPPVQSACLAAPDLEPDITDEQLADIVFYQATLAVPAPRAGNNAALQRGQQMFSAAGCEYCHVAELETGTSALLPMLANRHFAAYTDLLLHDMGEGLADGRPDFLASGREWRTAPLWGIGLISTVNEHSTLLHDGRARGVLEAILWHGGEAEAAKARVMAMTLEDRQALVNFINSL